MGSIHTLYRRLTELGHDVWVIDLASIEVSRHRRTAKSDGIDADKLVELMQRKGGGERRALRIVRVPNASVEDQLQLPGSGRLADRPAAVAKPDRIGVISARLPANASKQRGR